MVVLEFEKVWELLRRRLEGKPVETLVTNRRNRVVHVLDSKIVRQVETADSKGWIDASDVSKSSFREVWGHLARCGNYRVRKYFAAACLVSVHELGVEKVKGKPLTIKLRAASGAESSGEFDEEDSERFGDRERIVLDPNICSGKPTIRGTRIMVNNILGMFAGGYSFNKILKAYPELSPLDVISAVEYASWVVDREPGVA